MLSLPVLLTTPISRLGLIVHFVDWAVFLLFHVLGRHLHVATGEDDVPICLFAPLYLCYLRHGHGLG